MVGKAMCTTCTAVLLYPVMLEARMSACRAHANTDKHQDAVSKLATREAEFGRPGVTEDIRVLNAAGHEAAYRAKLMQLKVLLHILRGGRPIMEYIRMRELLQDLDVARIPLKHWSELSAWALATALAQVGGVAGGKGEDCNRDDYARHVEEGWVGLLLLLQPAEEGWRIKV